MVSFKTTTSFHTFSKKQPLQHRNPKTSNFQTSASIQSIQRQIPNSEGAIPSTRFRHSQGAKKPSSIQHLRDAVLHDDGPPRSIEAWHKGEPNDRGSWQRLKGNTETKHGLKIAVHIKRLIDDRWFWNPHNILYILQKKINWPWCWGWVEVSCTVIPPKPCLKFPWAHAALWPNLPSPWETCREEGAWRMHMWHCDWV